MKKLNKPTTMLVAFAIAAAMTGCGNDDEPNNDNNSNNGSYEINGHTFVDLGLPSGLLWADRNVGADSPYDIGDYFAWGEVLSKTTYTDDNYKWGDDCENPTKYNFKDGKNILDAVDDAATFNWGTNCRMPTESEFQELYDRCTWSHKENYNGADGYLIIGPNGNSIFFPYTDFYKQQPWYGYYWAKTSYDNYTDGAGCLSFTRNHGVIPNNYSVRSARGSVRPVSGKISYNDNSGSSGGNSGGSGGSSNGSGGGSTSYEKPDIALEDYTTYPTKIKVNYRIYNQDKAKVTSAKVYYGTSSPSKSISTTVAGTLITTYISGLKKGTTYYVKCIATGKGGSTTSETTRIITDF